MKCYYAHCIAIYNTPQERRDVELLRTIGFDVVNPNSPEHDAAYKEKGMAHFEALVADCDVLAFRALPDGSIPAGIGREIANAKLVVELPSGIDRRVLTVDQTRSYLKECGAR